MIVVGAWLAISRFPEKSDGHPRTAGRPIGLRQGKPATAFTARHDRTWAPGAGEGAEARKAIPDDGTQPTAPPRVEYDAGNRPSWDPASPGHGAI